MRTITTWFILTAPWLILLCDYAVYRLDGYEATITAVVRDWHERWPLLTEGVFVLGVVLLWGHLYRRWF